jgi:hypothetical protein
MCCQLKNGLRSSRARGRLPETLSLGWLPAVRFIPAERVSGNLPRALAHTFNSQKFLDPKPSARHSALSSAYPLQGAIPAKGMPKTRPGLVTTAWHRRTRLLLALQGL